MAKDSNSIAAAFPADVVRGTQAGRAKPTTGYEQPPSQATPARGGFSTKPSFSKRLDPGKLAIKQTGTVALHAAETLGTLFMSSLAEGFLGAEKLRVGGIDLRAPIGLAAQGFGLYSVMTGEKGGEHALAIGNGITGSLMSSIGREAGLLLRERRGGTAQPPAPQPAPQGAPSFRGEEPLIRIPVEYDPPQPQPMPQYQGFAGPYSDLLPIPQPLPRRGYLPPPPPSWQYAQPTIQGYGPPGNGVQPSAYENYSSPEAFQGQPGSYRALPGPAYPPPAPPRAYEEPARNPPMLQPESPYPAGYAAPSYGDAGPAYAQERPQAQQVHRGHTHPPASQPQLGPERVLMLTPETPVIAGPRRGPAHALMLTPETRDPSPFEGQTLYLTPDARAGAKAAASAVANSASSSAMPPGSDSDTHDFAGPRERQARRHERRQERREALLSMAQTQHGPSSQSLSEPEA